MFTSNKFMIVYQKKNESFSSDLPTLILICSDIVDLVIFPLFLCFYLGQVPWLNFLIFFVFFSSVLMRYAIGILHRRFFLKKNDKILFCRFCVWLASEMAFSRIAVMGSSHAQWNQAVSILRIAQLCRLILPEWNSASHSWGVSSPQTTHKHGRDFAHF